MTLRESLRFEHELLLPNITFDCQPSEATHVVFGIVYGYCVCANFERHVAKSEDKKEIEGKLKVAMGGVPLVTTASGNVNTVLNETQVSTVNSFNIKIYADFNLEDELPQNVEQAIAFFRKLPQYTKNIQAKPIEYILYPLDMIKYRLGATSVDNLTIRDITEVIMVKMHHNADQLLKLKRQYNQYYETYLSVKACISKVSRAKIENKKLAISICEFAYRKKLADLLLELRVNNLNEMEFLQQSLLDEVVNSYEQSYVLKDKINMLSLALNRGCYLIDEYSTPHLLPNQYGQDQKHLFLLYMNEQLIETKAEQWNIIQPKFFDLMDRFKTEAFFFIINYDLHSQLISRSSDFLLEHYYGIKLIKDASILGTDPLNKQYCETCGAEDYEERFIVLSESNRVWLNRSRPERLQKLNIKINENGKVIMLYERNTSSLDALCQYETLSAGNHLQYSTGKHHIEFQIVDLYRAVEFSLSTSSMNNVTFDIWFGAPLSGILSTPTQKGDIYELVIDCNEINVQLINQRTASTKRLNIDISKHPFPWKYRFCQDASYLQACLPITIRIKNTKHFCE
ncbi:unnamed protein product [Rotaria sp. Silwood2]|nr:unnamed protein product [Rotaria sp. Silwood2]CAF4585665.1 unnamed protein product [Rotaria sp. Silwood2]